MIFNKKDKDSIRSMFNQIAPNYDLINKLMTFGLQDIIKASAVKSTIKKLGKTPISILDLCCGTGDISILFKKFCQNAEITGIDFSEEMLKKAKRKAPNINFIQGDITKIVMVRSRKNFDICFIGFGLRNLPDIDDFLENIKSSLAEGGILAILDLGKPALIMKPYFFLHYNVFIPIIAKLFYKDISPYKYLTNSAKTYPSQKEILQKLRSHGFIETENRNYFFGIIAMQTAKYSRGGE